MTWTHSSVPRAGLQVSGSVSVWGSQEHPPSSACSHHSQQVALRGTFCNWWNPGSPGEPRMETVATQRKGASSGVQGWWATVPGGWVVGGRSRPLLGSRVLRRHPSCWVTEWPLTPAFWALLCPLCEDSVVCATAPAAVDRARCQCCLGPAANL